MTLLRNWLAQVRAGMADNRRHLVIGVAGVVVTALALLASAVLYLFPIGDTVYTADFRSSGGLRSGDEIRIAGIRVGTVQSVRLAGNHVEVRFGVDRSTTVGDMSTAEVKLLTPIGGHFVSLTSVGSKDLGSTHIPVERTSTPYELNDILEGSAPVLEKIDGTALRQTIAELNQAITGQPEAIRDVIGTVNELAGVLAQRSDQLGKALQVSDEYIGALADDKAVLLGLIANLRIAATKLAENKALLVEVFDLTNRGLAVLHRPIMDFGDAIEPPLSDLEEVVRKLSADPAKIDTAIAAINTFIEKVTPMLGTDGTVRLDQSAATVQVPQICVPSPGKEC